MKRNTVIAMLLTALLLAGCGSPFARTPAATVDPYAGMIQVESGFGTKMWVKLQETLEKSPFLGWAPGGAEETENSLPEGYRLSAGVDVSEHQGEIDWEAAAADGVEFAVIRAGYRGYGVRGTLVEDAAFRGNMDGALAAGIAVGAYFFSQAITPEEAEEEAAFLLALLEPYGPALITLPVFFDWEDIEHDTARTDGLDGESITSCAEAFCARVREAGYTPGVYAYRYLAYFSYDLPRLGDVSLWIGALGDRSDFYYAHEFWQYRVAEGVKGINGAVDRDYRMERIAPPAEEA